MKILVINRSISIFICFLFSFFIFYFFAFSKYCLAFLVRCVYHPTVSDSNLFIKWS